MNRAFLVGSIALLPALLVGARLLDAYPGLVEKNGALVPSVIASKFAPETGLQKPFPQPIVEVENPTTVKRVELGRLLFFDPVLSVDESTSCASCHHPDLGFGDGLPRSIGLGGKGAGAERKGGKELTRAAPTLWNSMFNHRQFWDGRAKTLEEQAKGPISDPDEMANDPQKVVDRLKTIPEYVRHFDEAFGGEISFDKVVMAIAAFERTLVSFNSRFDQYASGNGTALSPTEKRGLKLYLSTKARCSECHGMPTFANPDFKVIGVPDPPDGPKDVHKEPAEKGRGGGPTGAYKVPTLRNVALTAPYMHNGAFKTLEEVVDFYSNGGGRGKGLDIPLQDDKIRKFQLTKQERADLVAFMHSLTDVSAMPAIPDRVPSGLPVVKRISDPVRQRAVQASRAVKTPDRPMVVEIGPGQSLQEAVDRAGRGGTVKMRSGVYHENILVIHHGVTIEGIGPTKPIIDGRNRLPDAIVGLGNDFTVRNLEVRNYQGNGIVVHGARNVRYDGIKCVNTGVYGIYPVGCDGVLIENCEVTQVADAGIYVGQSKNVVVRNSVAYKNVAGIEIENCENSLVEGNYCYENTGGLLVFVLPFNPSKVCVNTVVRNNRLINNNTPNFGDPDAIVSKIPKGSGLIILAADNTLIYDNAIEGNSTFGIAMLGLNSIFPAGTKYDVDPSPDGNQIYGNKISGNGLDPDPTIVKMGLPGRDLFWDLSGKGNRWMQPGASSFPPSLPK